MIAKRLTHNGIVGLVLALAGIGGFIWTFSSPLRPMELFVPRIAMWLIIIGGTLVLLRDLMKPDRAEQLSKALVLPYAIGVALAMWLYGWAFRNIGLVTSTFLFLAIWWIWVAFRDARCTGSTEGLAIRIAKLLALALAIAVVIHLLFISLLNMHMPRTLLP